ncbi:hypothetical protein EIP91_003343 [Steccherinum ochraceum]|uniref:Uncharacterized protein n=1 Tax=Steccherinum ochraceum TaxID=92696 RepID=A0A4R0RCB6_9APHY|nr:hypothetical protein EIP91_003343 [Steccherinum ochraceum]
MHARPRMFGADEWEPVLYLPERLTEAYDPRLQPLLSGMPRDLRFPVPTSVILPDTAELRQQCLPLYSLPLRTQDRSQKAYPKLPAAIEQLGEKDRLLNIKRCTASWQRLVDYTEVDTPVNTWQVGSGSAGHTGKSHFPPPEQQARAVMGLLSWVTQQSLRHAALVNSELSVDDAFYTQILHPIDMLLQTRYTNTASDKLKESTLERHPFGWAQETSQAHTVFAGLPPAFEGMASSTPAAQRASAHPRSGPSPQPIEDSDRSSSPLSPLSDEEAGSLLPARDEQAQPEIEVEERSLQEDHVQAFPENVFLPCWSRSVIASHIWDALNAGQWPKAGLPDRLLLRSANLGDHGALGELKTFWSVSDEVLASIFSAQCAHPQTGFFSWQGSYSGWLMNGPGSSLLKQIWGQLHYFRTKWGFLTNGSTVMLFIKTGAQELTLTEPHSLTDDDVLQALLGLSFASIDCEYNSQEERDLMDHLCPEDEREADWPASTVDQDQFGDISALIAQRLGRGPDGSGWLGDATFDNGGEPSRVEHRRQPAREVQMHTPSPPPTPGPSNIEAHPQQLMNAPGPAPAPPLHSPVGRVRTRSMARSAAATANPQAGTSSRVSAATRQKKRETAQTAAKTAVRRGRSSKNSNTQKKPPKGRPSAREKNAQRTKLIANRARFLISN